MSDFNNEMPTMDHLLVLFGGIGDGELDESIKTQRCHAIQNSEIQSGSRVFFVPWLSRPWALRCRSFDEKAPLCPACAVPQQAAWPQQVQCEIQRANPIHLQDFVKQMLRCR